MPDLNGVWQALNTANFDIQAHAARPALAITPASPRTAIPGLARSTHVDLPAPSLRVLGAVGGVPAGAGVVEGNEIPYQPWALARKKENADNWLERDPEIKCFMPGVPRATYMPYPFQILQGSTKILMAYEFAGATRTIPLDPVGDSPSPTWMGWSRGRWEGETLVVEVTDFNEETWFDRAGKFSQRRAARRRALYSPSVRTTSSTRRPSRIRKSSRVRGRSGCRSIDATKLTCRSWNTSAWSSSSS